jgi:nucleotide-binding universal stress UspA family protein
MMRPVVVGVDGTGRSLRALLWAARDAVIRNRPLHVIHTLPRYEMDVPLFPPGRFELAEIRGKEILAEALTLVGEAHPGLEVSTDQPMQTPAAAMLEASDRAAEIVLGAKGEDVGNLLLGSTALQVVGHARCPVAVVGHVAIGHRRVAVGSDGSSHSTRALGYAFEAAHLRGAELEVVSALGLPQGWPKHLLWPIPEDDDEVAARQREVEAQIAPLEERFPDVDVMLNVHRSAPLETLTHASHRADLIVLGSRGRGGFHGLALGSVTHRMLHLAGCPIVVVPGEIQPAE